MMTEFRRIFLAVAALGLVFTGCSPERSDDRPEAVIPYDLDAPVEYDLIEDLQEISGISPLPGDSSLWAINDETGKVYTLSLTGKVLSEKWFHKGGDYEDIAAYGREVYVMKSNGNLYRIEDPSADSLQAKSYKAGLSKEIEFESLAADTVAGRLWLLVKDGESEKGKAPIYGFDVKTGTYLSGHMGLLDPRTAPHVSVKGKSLRASAMALHPITGELYVVSSIQRMLLVCDRDGNGIASHKLSKKRFPQPEGICFLANGDMFISSEGLSRPAKLYRFAYAPGGKR